MTRFTLLNTKGSVKITATMMSNFAARHSCWRSTWDEIFPTAMCITHPPTSGVRSISARSCGTDPGHHPGGPDHHRMGTVPEPSETSAARAVARGPVSAGGDQIPAGFRRDSCPALPAINLGRTLYVDTLAPICANARNVCW